MRRLLELVAGLLLRRVVGPPAAERGAPAARPRRAGPAPRGPGDRPAPAPSGRPRGALVGVMLGALAVGALLMLLFEAWFTRLAGVVSLFAFVVTGVFVITGSGLLDPDQAD